MNRTEMRSQIKQALDAAAVFDLVVQGKPDTMGGVLTVAVIQSASTQREQLTRELTEDTFRFVVSIYVQRAANGNSAAEDTLDALSAATFDAIDAAFPGALTWQPSDAGGGDTPNRRLDGKIWRIERIGFTIPSSAY